MTPTVSPTVTPSAQGTDRAPSPPIHANGCTQAQPSPAQLGAHSLPTHGAFNPGASSLRRTELGRRAQQAARSLPAASRVGSPATSLGVWSRCSSGNRAVSMAFLVEKRRRRCRSSARLSWGSALSSTAAMPARAREAAVRTRGDTAAYTPLPWAAQLQGHRRRRLYRPSPTRPASCAGCSIRVRQTKRTHASRHTKMPPVQARLKPCASTSKWRASPPCPSKRSSPATCAAACDVPLCAVKHVLQSLEAPTMSSPGANRSTQRPKLVPRVPMEAGWSSLSVAPTVMTCQ